MRTSPPTLVQSTRRKRSFEDTSRPSGTGVDLSMGLLAGYAQTVPADNTKESRFSGYHLAARALLAVSYEWFNLGVGVGYLRNELRGSYATYEEQGGTAGGMPVRLDSSRIRTRAGFAELLPQAQFNHVRAGPAVQIPFGTVAAFSPTPMHRSRTPVLGGVAAGWKFGNGAFLGMQLLADLNIRERHVMLALLDARYVFELVERHTRVDESVQVSVVERVARKTRKVAVENVIVKERVRYLFDNRAVNFETASAQLSPASRELLRKVGRFLSENDGIYVSLEIDGHTDSRGGGEYNQKLSQERAESVLAAFREAGVPEGKMTARGFGLDRPLDRAETPQAWEKNRRVELSFVDVKDNRALVAFFESLGGGVSRGAP